MSPGYHKITIGGEPFCDYTDIVEWPAAGGGKKYQVIPGYGAPAVAYLDEGNLEITFEPTVTITWPDNTQSWAFFMTSKSFDGVADVLITHLDWSGVETIYKIASASVSVSTGNPSGPTTVSKLTIKGGLPQIQ